MTALKKKLITLRSRVQFSAITYAKMHGLDKIFAGAIALPTIFAAASLAFCVAYRESIY